MSSIEGWAQFFKRNRGLFTNSYIGIHLTKLAKYEISKLFKHCIYQDMWIQYLSTFCYSLFGTTTNTLEYYGITEHVKNGKMVISQKTIQKVYQEFIHTPIIE
jgi:hypothetical protein